MLNLLLGPAGSGKTEFLLEKLINYSDNNIVNSDILIILPSRAACDSFIHQFDKTPILGLNIETFRSFSLRIIENENIGLKPLNYGFTYFLNIALDSILENNNSYPDNNSVISILDNWNKTTSKQNLYNTLSSFMRENITGRKFQKIADNTNNLLVANTCSAFAILLDKYKSLLKENGFYDESETENISANIISKLKKQHTKYKLIIVDGFNRFVQSQIEVLIQLVRNTESYVSFCIDESRKDSIFFKYQSKLINRFSSNVRTKYEINNITFSSPKHFANSQIRELETNLIFDEPLTKSKYIQQITAETPYEEITKVALKIKNIVLNNNIPLDKIAIIYRSNDPYADIIPNILTKYNIPSNYTSFTKLINIPIFQWFIHLIQMQKNYISHFDDLFNEIELWDLYEFFVSDFTYELILLNCDIAIDKSDLSKCADKIIESGLFSFQLLYDSTIENCDDLFVLKRKKDLSKADLHIIMSLNLFFKSISKISNEIELIENMLNIVLKINSSFLHIYPIIVDAISKYKISTHAQTALDLKSYLNIIANEINILDKKSTEGVRVANIVSFHNDNDISTLFIVGLNQSIFPVLQSPTTYLSEDFITILSSNYGFNTRQSFHDYEDFLFYKALTRTSEYLFLCHAEQNLKGDSLNKSMYMQFSIFSNLNEFNYTKKNWEIILQGFQQRFYTRTINELDNNTEIKIDKKILYNSINYLKNNKHVKYISERHSLSTTKTIINYNDYKVSVKSRQYLNLSKFTNTQIEKLIEENKIVFSHSSLKKYLTCPYKFLLDNIFRIKELKQFDIDAGIWGNIFHKAMEKFAEIFSKYLIDYNFAEIYLMKQNIIENTMLNLSQYFSNNYRIFRYRSEFKQFEKNAQSYKEFLNKEIDRRISLYAKPGAVELAFGIPSINNEENSKSNLLIKSENDKYLEIEDGQHKIWICGFIDLVDIIQVNNISNYLIIDYKKTSDFNKYKEIVNLFTFRNLEEIWTKNSINKESTFPILNFTNTDFQLPIYIMAMKRIFKIDNINSALFYHLFSNQFAGFVSQELSEIFHSVNAKNKIYNNVRKNIENSEIDMIVDNAEKLIKLIVNQMKNGVFPISPDISHSKTSKTPCDYCPYISICRINSN